VDVLSLARCWPGTIGAPGGSGVIGYRTGLQSRRFQVRVLAAPLKLDRARALALNAIGGLASHHGTQSAASMAYYALFSIFPTAIVLTAIAGLVLDERTVRTDVVDFLLNSLPINGDAQGRQDLESLVVGVTHNSGAVGLFGGLVLLVSASALISATRNSIDTIFGGSVTRGALRGKALDLLLVLGIGLLFIASLASTLLSGLDVGSGGGVLQAIESALTASGFILPAILSSIVFSVAYTILPVERLQLRDVWPGVVFAVVGYEVLKLGFSLYVDNFANYNVVYGSLGAAMAFMFFVYLASVVFLLGAEVASLWPRIRAGEFDSSDDDDGPSTGEQVTDFVRSLVRRNRADR
jgi:membrane protein